MRLIAWLLSLIAELWTRRRWRCVHEYSDRCYPPTCLKCFAVADSSPDWGC